MIAGGGELSQAKGSDHWISLEEKLYWWRGAISDGGEQSQVWGGYLRWRGVITVGGEAGP